MSLRLLFVFFLLLIFTTIGILIVSDYRDGQTRFLRQRYLSELVSGESNASRRAATLASPPRYLWCVNHYGPNNQIRDFAKCAVLALMNNYTLVLPPLYPHYGDNLRGIQWFDQFYDLKLLRLAVKFVTLDEFVRQTVVDNRTDLQMDCYVQQIDLVKDRTWYSLNTLGSVQSFYRTRIRFHRYVNLTRNFNMTELRERSKDCSSIFLHVHYTTYGYFFSAPNVYTQRVFAHLSRSPLIQSMAQQAISFLPQLMLGGNSTTKFKKLLVAHLRLGDYTVMSVSRYRSQIAYLVKNRTDLTHLHIMCPYLNASEIDLLTRNLSIPVTTTGQLMKAMRFLLNDFLFDVLEQEIAFQAPVFLASPWTTYSATVMMQKVHQDRGAVYLFSTGKENRPFLVTKSNVRYF